MTGSGKELVASNQPRPVGRPRGSGSIYTQDIADEIVERMSNGETLISICRQDRYGNARFAGEGFPNHATVYDWGDPADAAYKSDFGPRFARAKLAQQRYWLEECHEIAHTPEPGEEEVREISAKNGATIRRTRKDMLGHRALKIDTNLKIIARMNPQLWSERLQQFAQTGGSAEGQEPPRIIVRGGLPDDGERPEPSVPRSEE